VNDTILRVEALTLCAGKKRLIDSLSFSIRRGECYALVGESGSGKSMTSLAIMRLLPDGVKVRSGDIRFEEMSLFDISEAKMCDVRGGRIAMIFQEPMNALNPVKTVGEQIVEAIALHRPESEAQMRKKAIELLLETGIPDPKERFGWYPHQLSGGQKQRVMIAMALACEPALLIADEPTTALDVTVQAQVLELLNEIRKRRSLAMLFISHDLGVVAQTADRIGVLKEGVLVEEAPCEHFFKRPKHPYTRTLLHRYDTSTKNADASRNEILLETRHVYVRFTSGGLFRRKRVVEAVKDVSVRIPRSKTLALVGESGSGKSTLGKAILSLVPVSEGEIRFNGVMLNRLDEKALRPYRRKIQMIFQDPFASLNPRMRIGEIIAEGMEATGMKVDDRDAYIRSLLEAVELEGDAMHRFAHAFSGGQRQRIAIARALAVEPDLIVCDEPTSALDVVTREQVLDLLRRIQQRRGVAYLFITHDLALVPRIADTVAVMRQGEIVEYGDVETVMNSPKHPYTQKLLQSVPHIPFTEPQ
jgi:peptide/nickel transport system ATP-binding protein